MSMTEWNEVSLAEVTQQVRDVVKVQRGSAYPLLGVRWYAKGPFLREVATAENSKATTLYRVTPGLFIYNRLFAWKGSFGLVGDALDGSYVSNEFPLFECNAARLLPRYLNLHFQQTSLWSLIDEISTGTTASRNRWKEQQFGEHLILLPPLPEQRRIVDVMSAVDAQIDALEEESVLHDNVYRSFLTLLVTQYPLVSIADVVTRATSGGTPSRKRADFFDGDIPWLKSGEVEDDRIETAKESITEAGLAACAARLVPAGATLVAMYGQGDTKGRAGYVMSPVATNQAVLALTPNGDRVHARYLLHAVRSRTDALRQRAVGAAQPNLSKALVISTEIPLPLELGEQERLANGLDSIRNLTRTVRAELASLRIFRSSLLTALLSQAITIPEAYDAVLEVAA